MLFKEMRDVRVKLLPFLVMVMTCMLVTVQPLFSQNSKPGNPARAVHSLNDTLIPFVVNKVSAYSFTIDRNNFLLRKKYNFTAVETDLKRIEKSLKGFKSRLERKGRVMNLLSLNSSVILLGEMVDRLAGYQSALSMYCSQLAKNKKAVQEIMADPDLNMQLPDSVIMEQLQDIREEGRQLAFIQQATSSNLNLLLNRVSVNLLQANDIMSDLRYLTISMKMELLQPEDLPLFKAHPSTYPQSFLAISLKAVQLSVKIISIYMNGKWNVLVVSVLLFLVITTWCGRNILQIRRRENAPLILEEVHFLRKGVLVGSLMAFFVYSPLLYADPTISYLHANEFFLLFFLSLLLVPYLAKHSKILWALLCMLWLYYTLDDLLLESSFAERWGLFISGILLLSLCFYLLRSRKRIFYRIRESGASKPLLVFTLALALLSVICNLSGNLTLAKIAGVSAIESLVMGIALKVFSTMVLEAIYLHAEAYAESRFSEFINYKDVEARCLKLLWILAPLVWLVALLRHLTLYSTIKELIISFFLQERTIGNMTFTYGSALVFVSVIWISSIISKLINLFFNYGKASVGGKRSSVGSFMLLIRLAIWAVGFLIAVAASGIPLDKLSLMIGALGVGIGFGLQNIVNNLVSGVIIAFERPIQIGDLIEVGNKKGVVEEIGVRSSKIKSGDGADIIIPNGDLLAQHLINWTMKDRFKRVEFIIGVAYQTDIRQARELILETLRNNTRILTPPDPVVIVQDFTDTAINIRIMFWSSEVSQAGTLRSNAMMDIFNSMNAAGIQLPYPRP